MNHHYSAFNLPMSSCLPGGNPESLKRSEDPFLILLHSTSSPSPISLSVVHFLSVPWPSPVPWTRHTPLYCLYMCCVLPGSSPFCVPMTHRSSSSRLHRCSLFSEAQSHLSVTEKVHESTSFSPPCCISLYRTYSFKHFPCLSA